MPLSCPQPMSLLSIRLRGGAMLLAVLLLLAQSALLLHGLEHDAAHADAHCALCVTSQHTPILPLSALEPLVAPVLAAPAVHPDIFVVTGTAMQLWQARAPPV